MNRERRFCARRMSMPSFLAGYSLETNTERREEEGRWTGRRKE